jgi:cation:H+ antiporter
MLIAIAGLIIGFGVLIWGADRFVMGAAALAHQWGVSPLLIGLTIVGFGTSAPEIMVSAMAAWQGNPGLAIGNAIGSNIANIGLILGVSAIITPLIITSSALRREYPLLLSVSVFAYVLLLDGVLSRFDSLFLLSGLIASLVWLVKVSRNTTHDGFSTEIETEVPTHLSALAAGLWFCVGLALVLGGSQLLVWSATEIAKALGMSDLLVGLTIVAIGTSLPELATSVISALKKEHDIAVGNVLGSNLYNLLAVLPIPGLLAPTLISDIVLIRDFPLLLLLTVALLFLGYRRSGMGQINRYAGIVLLCSFLGYQSWLLIE